MPKFMAKDEVKDADKNLLGFGAIDEQFVQQGTGQLTTFNQLGIKGIPDKPDGWYIPDNKNDVAILLETKSSNEDVRTKKSEKSEDKIWEEKTMSENALIKFCSFESCRFYAVKSLKQNAQTLLSVLQD